MEETTNPTEGVVSEEALVERAAKYVEQFDAEQDDTPLELQKDEPEPEGQAPTEEAPEAPEVEAQPAVDEFEIVFNGQPEKVSRAEMIELAQKGKDYTQKTQALAESSRTMQATMQRAQEMLNLAPYVTQDLAQVKALEANLAQFQNVDWVALATNDPLEYPKHRAQYDIALQAHQQAISRFQQSASKYQQQQQAIAQQVLVQEAQAMRQVIPEWANQEVYQKEATEIARFLVSRGIPQEYVDNLGRNAGDAIAVALARDAWKYSQLKSGKDAKVGQVRNAPPVPRPSASAPSAAATQERQRLQSKLAKTGEVNDAAALLLNRWKR